MAQIRFYLSKNEPGLSEAEKKYDCLPYFDEASEQELNNYCRSQTLNLASSKARNRHGLNMLELTLRQTRDWAVKQREMKESKENK